MCSRSIFSVKPKRGLLQNKSWFQCSFSEFNTTAEMELDMMGKKCPLYCGLVGDSHPSVSQLLHAHTAHTKVPIMKNTRLHLPSRASLIPNLENCIPSYAHHRTPVYIIRQQAPLNSIYKWVQSLNEIKFGLFFYTSTNSQNIFSLSIFMKMSSCANSKWLWLHHVQVSLTILVEGQSIVMCKYWVTTYKKGLLSSMAKVSA